MKVYEIKIPKRKRTINYKLKIQKKNTKIINSIIQNNLLEAFEEDLKVPEIKINRKK